MSDITIRPNTGEIVVRQAERTLVIGRRVVSAPSVLSGYVEVNTPQITGSTTLVDITGASFDMTLTESSRILATMVVETKTGVSLIETGWAISINGVDGQEMQTSPGTFPHIATVLSRSPVLTAGTYEVKGRFRIEVAISNVLALVTQLSAIQVRA